MANQYPGALNNYVTGASSATLAVAGHAAEHNAVETKLGIDGSGDTNSIDYKLKNTASINPGHKHTGAGLSGVTGSGNVVLDTSPTLVTPVLGVATATSINKVTLTQPATAAILTIINNKTLTVNNSLGLSGTDGQTFTFPNGSDTVVTLGASQTLTNKVLTNPTINGSILGGQTNTPGAGGTATLDISLAQINHIVMPAGNITIALSNATTNRIFIIDITQDSVGSRTVTWFTTIRWATGVAPTLTLTANKRDAFGFIVTGGNTYDGFIVGQNI